MAQATLGDSPYRNSGLFSSCYTGEETERTDDLIDEIVYELYGLTDEEIVEDAVAG